MGCRPCLFILPRPVGRVRFELNIPAATGGLIGSEFYFIYKVCFLSCLLFSSLSCGSPLSVSDLFLSGLSHVCVFGLFLSSLPPPPSILLFSLSLSLFLIVSGIYPSGNTEELIFAVVFLRLWSEHDENVNISLEVSSSAKPLRTKR